MVPLDGLARRDWTPRTSYRMLPEMEKLLDYILSNYVLAETKITYGENWRFYVPISDQ